MQLGIIRFFQWESVSILIIWADLSFQFLKQRARHKLTDIRTVWDKQVQCLLFFTFWPYVSNYEHLISLKSHSSFLQCMPSKIQVYDLCWMFPKEEPRRGHCSAQGTQWTKWNIGQEYHCRCLLRSVATVIRFFFRSSMFQLVWRKNVIMFIKEQACQLFQQAKNAYMCYPS